MSKIYAKWNDMKKVSRGIESDSKKISRCIESVRDVRRTLPISGDTGYAIKSKLKSDEERIAQLASDFNTYAGVLEMLADNYKNAEENNKRR